MAFDSRIHDPDYPDPIVEEIRAIKRKLAAECNYDLDKMFDDLRRKKEASGREYVSLPHRPVSKAPIPPLAAPNDYTVNQTTE